MIGENRCKPSKSQNEISYDSKIIEKNGKSQLISQHEPSFFERSEKSPVDIILPSNNPKCRYRIYDYKINEAISIKLPHFTICVQCLKIDNNKHGYSTKNEFTGVKKLQSLLGFMVSFQRLMKFKPERQNIEKIS